MRTIRLAATALAAAALLSTAIAGPAAAAPYIPKCAQLLPPTASALMGAPAVQISDTLPSAPFGLVGSRMSAVRTIVIANHGRTCVWRFGKTTVTMSVTGVTNANRTVIDKAWWVTHGVDGINTGGRKFIYHVAPPTESGYLVDDPYYITATTNNGTYFPAFVQLVADRLYVLTH